MMFETELREILREYKEESNDPLDDSETERLVRHLKDRINLIEGNITNKEFEELEDGR